MFTEVLGLENSHIKRTPPLRIFFRGGKSIHNSHPKYQCSSEQMFLNKVLLGSWLVSQGSRQKFARTFGKSSRKRGGFLGLSGFWVGLLASIYWDGMGGGGGGCFWGALILHFLWNMLYLPGFSPKPGRPKNGRSYHHPSHPPLDALWFMEQQNFINRTPQAETLNLISSGHGLPQASQTALKKTELRWQREPKRKIFAEKHGFSPIHPFSWKFKRLEGAGNRRKPQKTADCAPSPFSSGLEWLWSVISEREIVKLLIDTPGYENSAFRKLVRGFKAHA